MSSGKCQRKGVMSEFGSVIDLATLDGTTGFRLDGIDAGDSSGRSVASAGDVNGDGFDDIIIGASRADPGGDSDAGESYVVFGKATGFAAALDLSMLDGANGFRLDGIDAYDRSGFSVSSAGDVNGDGFDDIIIGAFRGDPGGHNAGESYVVFGKATGFAAALDPSTLDGVNGFRLDGIAAYDRSGISVSSAGDVDGDGFDDIIIGTYRGGVVGDYLGQSYVVFGKATGFAAALDLSTLDGANGFRLDGIHSYDYSGRSVSSAGDVNGDGFDDVIIGAWGAHGAAFRAGESYVVFGKAGGFSSSLDLSTLNGDNGFRLNGIDAYDYSGFSVSSAGDVNGDGFDDIIIGAFRGDPHGPNPGESYVVFGKPGGFSSSLDLSTLNGTNGFRLNGIDAYDYSGWSVSSAGDVNGDGYDDIIIGAPRGGRDFLGGESYVVFGKAGGFSSSLDLSTLDGANGFRLDGIDARDYSGHSVASTGDVNGDGFDDIIIGAYGGAPGGHYSAGESYVVFGRAPDAAVNRIGAAGYQYISGGAFDDRLSGLGGNDRLEGRGGADDLIGGKGKDTAYYKHASTPVTVDLTTPSNNQGDATGDTYFTIERFRLSGFADSFIGNGSDNVALGFRGNDTLDGLAGNDRLVGGAGGDSLDGGSGLDIASYQTARAGVTVDLSAPASNTGDAAGDGYVSIENLAGSRFGDRLTGDTGNNRLAGGLGHDALSGKGGNDVLAGGGSGDRLLGGGDDDRLLGKSGQDSLDGGAGRDVMTGGTKADRFDFNALGESGAAGSRADVVTDFTEGLDKIDVHDIDASNTGSGNEDFVFLPGDGDAFGVEGQARWYQFNGNTYIELNTAGTTRAELTIRLLGLHALTAGDFVL